MALADDLKGGARPLLYVDWLDYAARLLEGGQVDWGNAAAVASLLGRAQGLLASDIVLIPVDRFLAARLASDAALRAAVTAKKRNLQPLKALLADEAIRADLVELFGDVRAQVRGAALGVLLPAPAPLMELVAGGCGIDAPDLDDDLVEDAAVLVADFIRSWSTSPVELVALDEAPSAQAPLHGPVVKVADHFGWALAARRLGVLTAHDGAWPKLETMTIAADANPEQTLAALAEKRKSLS